MLVTWDAIIHLNYFLNIMKFKESFLALSLLAVFYCFTTTLNAQDCQPYTASTSGDIDVKIYTELGECFQVQYEGVMITPEKVSQCNLKSSIGIHPVKVIMENGTEITKKLAFQAGQASGAYEIQRNKKGKYSLKNKIWQATMTEEERQRREDEAEAKKKEREAEKAKADAEWDREQEERRQRMKESVKIDSPSIESESSTESSGSLLSPYEDTRQGIQGDPDRQGIQGDPNRQGIQGNANAQGIQGNADQQGRQGRTDLGTQSGGATTSSSESKTSTESSAPKPDPNDPKITTGKDKFQVQIWYKETPITDTYLTVLINDKALGTGLTDWEGKTWIYTDLPIPSTLPIELRGEKGSTKWSMDGFFLLNAPPEATFFPLEKAMEQMAEFMGMSEVDLARNWNFIK